MDEKIRLFVSERIDEALQELRRTNNDYDATRKVVGENSGRMEDIIAILSEADRDTWEQHFTISNKIAAIEQEWIYLQGVRDGFKLLNWIQD